jgi:xylulokinase
MSFMGLDLGGSGAKASIYAEDGSSIAASKMPYTFVAPRPDWREYDPQTVLAALMRAIQAVTSTPAVRRDPVRAIGISVAAEAVVPVGADGTPLYNTIASFDTRGSEYLPLLGELLGEEELYRITGQPLDHLYSLMRILWFRDYMPSVFAKAEKFHLWQELVLARLGIEPALEYSNAARTMAFDIGSRVWSEPILRAVDVPADLFAPLVPSGSLVGCVATRQADELGVPSNCPVVAGAMDQSCASLGLGVVDPTLTAVGTGSVEAVDIPLEDREALAAQARHFLYVTPYAPGGLLGSAHHFTAGSAVEWYRNLVGATSYDDLYGGRAPEIGAPSSLLVLPQFAGSFVPARDAAARAAIIGLSLSTSANDIARALLEGLVFELRLTMETMEGAGLRVGEVRNGGGGAHSETWMRLKATALGRAIAVPASLDSSSLGAALLAAVGVGVFADCRSAAASMVHIKQRYEPEGAAVAAFAERYQEYCAMRERLAAERGTPMRR